MDGLVGEMRDPTRELDHITAAETRLRRRRIVILRSQLTKLREAAAAIERELRALGDPEAMRSAGRIAWESIFAALGPTFTAREIAAITGASPRHVAVITHKWRQEDRIKAVGHGVFRKLISRER